MDEPAATTTAPTAASKSGKGRLVVVVAAAVVVAAVAAVLLIAKPWASDEPAKKFEVRGSLALTGRVDLLGTGEVGELLANPDDSSCEGTSGYDDIRAGAQVVVSDSSGKTLALGSLGSGSYDPDSTGLDITCTFRFTVTDVPEGKKFYRVAVSHRGEQQYSETELKTDSLSLTLGS